MLATFATTNPRPHRRKVFVFAAAAVLAATFSGAALAQNTDWGQWERVGTAPGTPGLLPGTGYPGGKECGADARLSGRHAYWMCTNRCAGRTGAGYCWEAVSDAIYTCPASSGSKGFRRMEAIRYTSIKCGPEDWKRTKRLAKLYDETWTDNVQDPPPVDTPVTPPTTDKELPPTQPGDTPTTWGGGDPPWTPPEEHGKKTQEKKSSTGTTDTPKTTENTGKSETGKPSEKADIPTLPDDVDPNDLMNGPGDGKPLLADPRLKSSRSEIPSGEERSERHVPRVGKRVIEDHEPRTSDRRERKAHRKVEKTPERTGREFKTHGRSERTARKAERTARFERIATKPGASHGMRGTERGFSHGHAMGGRTHAMGAPMRGASSLGRSGGMPMGRSGHSGMGMGGGRGMGGGMSLGRMGGMFGM
jgi:hypothetical protein